MNAAPIEATDDVGEDLVILKVRRRKDAEGTWVDGELAGHRFQALVFEDHAEQPEWELGDSRISKLWVQRHDNRWVVFNWDRGEDVEAADRLAGAIVDFLCAGLADFIFAR